MAIWTKTVALGKGVPKDGTRTLMESRSSWIWGMAKSSERLYRRQKRRGVLVGQWMECLLLPKHEDLSS